MWWGPGIIFFIVTASAVLAVEHVCIRIVPVTDIGAISDFDCSTVDIHLFVRSCLSRKIVNDFEMGGKRFLGVLSGSPIRAISASHCL